MSLWIHNLSTSTNHHANGILIQLDADSSPPDSMKMFKKSTNTVLFSLNLDVYGYCYYNGTVKEQNGFHNQQSMLMKRLAEQTKKSSPKNFNGAPCEYADGMYNYFNLHEVDFHAKFTSHKWNGPCVLIFLNIRRLT